MNDTTHQMTRKKAKILALARQQVRSRSQIYKRTTLKAWQQIAQHNQCAPTDYQYHLAPHDYNITQQTIKVSHIIAAGAFNQAKKMSVDIRAAVIQCKRDYIQDITKSTADFFRNADMRHAYKTLKKLGPYKPQKPVSLKLADGQYAQTPEQVSQRWLEHFADLMHGNITTQQQLFEDARNNYIQTGSAENCSNFQHIPTMTQVSGAYAHANRYKAAGEDLISGQILKAFPWQIAQITHPLHTKVAITGTEPTQWTGPIIHPLHKPSKHNFDEPTSYRDVHLKSEIAKTHRRITRTTVMPQLTNYQRDNACGAYPGRGTDMATQTLIQKAYYAKKVNASFAAVFSDIAAAFPSVIREQLFQDMVVTDAILDKAGVDKHIANMMEFASSQTWATVQGSPDVFSLNRGSAPGDPWADVQFSFVFATALSRIHTMLDENDLLDDFVFVEGATVLAPPKQDPSDPDGDPWPTGKNPKRSLSSMIVFILFLTLNLQK